MPSIWEAISARAELVSLPDVYLRLKAVLDDPNSAMNDVARVISLDPAMTSRLLRLVNSAYFGLGTKIDSVQRATGLLGTQQVHDLVLAASVAQSFDGLRNDVMSMERFWRHSVNCAIAARELASMCNVIDSERVFVNGLLHDIGHLFIYQAVPTLAMQAIELAKARKAPLYKAERAVLNLDYAEVGAEMMCRWELPQSLWEPTACQVEPSKCTEFAFVTHLLRIAVMVTRTLEGGAEIEQALERVPARDWQATGLAPDRCGHLPDRIDSEFGSVLQLIYPQAAAA